ncbi:MAG: hypothetical protein LBL76_05810 [Treponema sp.]|jgi:hypothetical protein|nr:hypothetical protein [Treponema sp.]
MQTEFASYMRGNIQIPELVMVALLIIPAIQPYIRRLRGQTGLVWFPLLALGIGAGLFPAYGFRVECIPLLLCMVFLNICHGPRLFAYLGWLDQDDTPPSSSFTLVCLGFLVGTTAFALYFSPRMDTRLSVQGVQTRMIQDEARHVRLFLRLYGPKDPQAASPQRPLMLLVPPVFGSVGMVDQVCGKLRDYGFTVLSFSRQGFDLPAFGTDNKRYNLPIQEQLRILQALAQGNTSAAANAWGRALEDGRIEDVRFLLSYIRHGLSTDFPEATVDLNTLFLAGYEAGGSALALLGASSTFRAANPEVQGIMVVESPLWSVYQFDDPLSQSKAVSWGPIAPPQVPILFMTSDRVTDPQKRNRWYGPLLQILQTNAPVILAAVNGAGPFDYSDCPAKYPLYSACVPGNKPVPWKYTQFIEGTAAIMTNFASLILENAPHDTPSISAALSRHKGLGGTLHFETGGAWNLPDFGYILSP